MEYTRPPIGPKACTLLFYNTQSEADASVAFIPCRQSGCTSHSAGGYGLLRLIDQSVSIYVYKRHQVYNRVGGYNDIPIHAL